MSPTLRLLYAEDNPLDADLALSHFRQTAPDLQVEILGTGELCRERLDREPFDLLLLDNHLPDVDGIELLARLRAAGHKLPVVMLTVVGDEDSVARALLAGADDYVTKAGDYLTRLPALLRDLVARVRNRTVGDGAGLQRARRVLYIEPYAADAHLTLQHFATFAPHLHLHIAERCVDALDMLTQKSGFDLVMSDLRLPDMNALEFFHEAQMRGIDLPFIVITGHGDEQTAVALLRLGASDYIVKRDHYLTQLPHSIDHALHRFQLDRTTRRLRADLDSMNRTLEQRVAARNAELHEEIRERQQAVQGLKRSEALLRVAGRTARLGGWALDLPDLSLTWTDEVCDIHEVPAGHVLDLEGALQFVAPEWREVARRAVYACARDGTAFDLQMEIITAKGRRLWVRSTGEAEGNGAAGISRVQGALQDVDDYKRSERRINDQIAELLRWQQVMVNREGRALELKEEVNELLARLSLPPRYGNPKEP